MVNADELARSIVGAVAQLNMQAPAQHVQAPQERISALKQKADELLSGERIDKDVMPIMLELVTAMKSDISAEAKEEYIKQAQTSQTQAIHSELGRLVERFAQTSSNPELIRELKPSIVQKAIDEYNGNPGLVRRYQVSGEVDWNEMEKTVVKHVSKWSAAKVEDAKPAGGPAMKNSAPAGALDAGREVSKESLDERQQELFNAQTSFGMKTMNLARDAAEKRALGLISNAEKKSHATKR